MTSEQKVFRAEEVKEHKDAKSAWLIIHNRVYDVTKFIDEVSGLCCCACDMNVGRCNGRRLNFHVDYDVTSSVADHRCVCCCGRQIDVDGGRMNFSGK